MQAGDLSIRRNRMGRDSEERTYALLRNGYCAVFQAPPDAIKILTHLFITLVVTPSGPQSSTSVHPPRDPPLKPYQMLSLTLGRCEQVTLNIISGCKSTGQSRANCFVKSTPSPQHLLAFWSQQSHQQSTHTPHLALNMTQSRLLPAIFILPVSLKPSSMW